VSLSWEDRSEVTELLSRYALLLDRQRIDEWMDLFESDAVIDIQGLDPLTTEERRRDLGLTAPRGTHLSAPPVLREGDAEGTALVEQTFFFRDAATKAVLGGWYEGIVVKRGGTWRFRRFAVRFHRAQAGTPEA
jgi:SnoaL-like domain